MCQNSEEQAGGERSSLHTWPSVPSLLVTALAYLAHGRGIRSMQLRVCDTLNFSAAKDCRKKVSWKKK